ncbi:MAG: pseudouridine-5'-phosphate glycosidase [Actinobacteria bacterium]|jgi:pseudouridine-5'-phosphate glycosidase|nr:pseudouridine-5'-phosphate glycosidase [Actinomycetota bacterium]MBT3688154.1 pseudouridine-5'-phosphate glycosidase [Actinomycetota bacterium]MBT4037575.1 pseudouridine-5'-phosphate glycosidase [Actinomycetota bacterium]MBT4279376.1 pseudouridine-5'-phosphate glycosidase [Actinomycetota bacterium]MBT4343499.1 pseudouridine-5'-phosphate glycosidase [Actinomycetota bacterium]
MNDLPEDDTRIRLSDEVAEALHAGTPVVALESTIISHGLPHPRNLETAHAIETVVRENGSVPATVALLDGVIQVGLEDSDLDRIATSGDVAKVSLRDIGWVLARGGPGATTVAATMFAAHRAGIRVFATGGIGGVHRGDSGDVSADLTALGTLPVAVVCAGAKAILDLPRTLEHLETLGVPVIGQGTDVFPEFWTRGTDLPVTIRADDTAETASILRAHWSTGLTTGAVVAVPVPAENEADPGVVEEAVNLGLTEAAARGVSGSAVTPFLLAHIAESTTGASIDTNVALVLNNATTAGRIAAELASPAYQA